LRIDEERDGVSFGSSAGVFVGDADLDGVAGSLLGSADIDMTGLSGCWGTRQILVIWTMTAS
jgi:hypothetical protein